MRGDSSPRSCAAEELSERAQEVAQLFARCRRVPSGRRSGCSTPPRRDTFEEQLELEAQTQAELTQTRRLPRGRRRVPREAPAASSRAPTVAWSHPVRLVVSDDLQRWRLTVALRWLLALPHLFVLSVWSIVARWSRSSTGSSRSSAAAHPKRRTRSSRRFVRYQAHVYAYTYLVADPFPSFRGWFGTYPIDVAIAPPAPQARWKTLLRIVWVIPAYVFAVVLGYVLEIVAVLGFFVALAVGRYPRGFRDLGAYALRFQAQTFAYLLLLTDRYPALAETSAGGLRRPVRQQLLAEREPELLRL